MEAAPPVLVSSVPVVSFTNRKPKEFVDRASFGSSIAPLGVLVGILAYLALRPITLPCVGCDTGGMFYKCMSGTGINSITCESWLKGQKGINAVGRTVMSVGEYAKELTQFASKLPHYLYEFAATLKEQIVKVAAEIYARVKTFTDMAMRKLKEVTSMIGSTLYKTWEEVYDKVIRPLIAGMMKYIVEPVTELMNKVIGFAKMVIYSVQKALGDAGDIVQSAYDGAYQAAGALKKAVAYIFEETAKVIEKTVAGLRNGINSVMGDVVGGAEDAIKSVTGAMNTTIKGIEKVVDDTIGGVTGGIETSVNKVGQGIQTVAAGIEEGVNKGVQESIGATQKVVNEVAGGIEDGVNVLAQGVAKGVGSVLNETEEIVNKLGDMLEGSVNSAINVINTGISKPLESAINDSSDIVEKALDGVMIPIRGITTGLNKLGDVRINLGPIYDGRPFNFLSKIDPPKTPNVGHITIKPIGGIDLAPVDLPNVEFVKPSGNLGAAGPSLSSNAQVYFQKPGEQAEVTGRQKLQQSIAAAQKNWKIAANQARDDYAHAKYKNSKWDTSKTVDDDDEEDFVAPTTRKGAHLNIYDDDAKPDPNFAFLGTMLNQSRASAGVSDARNWNAMNEQRNRCPGPFKSQGAAVAPGYGDELGAAVAPGYGDELGAAVAPGYGDELGTSAYAPQGVSKPIVIKGISLKVPPIPLPKSLKLNLPPMEVKIKKENSITLPTIDMSKFKLKVPKVDFNVNISNNIPEMPNIVDEIGKGGRSLRKLLGNFMAPVWNAFASLFTYVNHAINMIWTFFTKEVSWANIKKGVLYALRKGWEGIKELGELIHKDIIVPFIAVVKWIGGHLIEAAKVFAKMALKFLGDMKKKIFDLGEDIWTKVKPFVKQVALVTSGVLMYSVGAILDRVPPFSILPMNTTSKVYTLLVCLVIFTTGAQLTFAKNFVVGILSKAMSPLQILDINLEEYADANWESLPSLLKSVSLALGFVPQI